MKKKILLVGYSGITIKHVKFLDKKKYDLYLISKHYKTKNFLNLINLKNAKKLFFNSVFICSAANNKIYYLNELIGNAKKFFLEKPISSSIDKLDKFIFTPAQKKKFMLAMYLDIIILLKNLRIRF